LFLGYEFEEFYNGINKYELYQKGFNKYDICRVYFNLKLRPKLFCYSLYFIVNNSLKTMENGNEIIYYRCMVIRI
jgi:hypothetical protein